MSYFLLLVSSCALLFITLYLKSTKTYKIICAWCDADGALKSWREANPASYIGQSEEAKKLLRELIDSYDAFLKTYPFVKDSNHKEYLLSLFNELPPEPPKPRKLLLRLQKPFVKERLLICKKYGFMEQMFFDIALYNDKE